MPKYDKPDSPNIIWGVNAVEGNLTKPSDDKIQTGWVQEKPPYHFENYSMNKLYQGFAYYNQMGIPEWDSETEYQAGKSYVQGSNGRVYKAIQTNTNKNPATGGNEIFWELFEGNRQATTASRGTVELATTSETSAGSANNLAVTPQSILQGIVGTGELLSKGHIKIPVNVGGAKQEFIIQWGRPAGAGNVTYNIPFPSRVLSIQVTDFSSSRSYGTSPSSVDRFGFSVISEDNDLTYYWLAIGY